MRSFLFFIARLLVGFATFAAVFSLIGGAPAEAIAGAIVFWVLAFLVGMVLSAPMALAPPATTGGWSLTLPILWWVFLFPFLIAAFVGRLVLQGGWTVLGLIWRPSTPAPAFAPTAAPAFAPTAPPSLMPPTQPAAPTGPGWYPDPTRRNLQRFFDGQRWTPHVANGPNTSIDPM